MRDAVEARAHVQRARHAELRQQLGDAVVGAVVERQRAQPARPLGQPAGELGHRHGRVAAALQRAHLRGQRGLGHGEVVRVVLAGHVADDVVGQDQHEGQL